MPNTVTARKRLRLAEKHRRMNRPVRTAARTAVRRVRVLLAQEDLPGAQKAMGRAYSLLDRAVKKGVIHRNSAARRKSRLMQWLNAVLAEAPGAPGS